MSKLQYNEIKEVLRNTFKTFLGNPENYLKNENQIEAVELMNSTEKHSLWKSFKDSQMKKFVEVNEDIISDDFRERRDVKSASKVKRDIEEEGIKINELNLVAILKHPERYQDILDKTFDEIQKLNKVERDNLLTEIIEQKNLNTSRMELTLAQRLKAQISEIHKKSMIKKVIDDIEEENINISPLFLRDMFRNLEDNKYILDKTFRDTEKLSKQELNELFLEIVKEKYLYLGNVELPYPQGESSEGFSSAFSNLWQKFFPISNKISNALMNLGEKNLEAYIKKIIPNYESFESFRSPDTLEGTSEDVSPLSGDSFRFPDVDEL